MERLPGDAIMIPGIVPQRGKTFRKRRWLVPLAILGSLVVYHRLRHRAAGEPSKHSGAMIGPHADLYDACSGLMFGGLYDKVAREVAGRCSTGLVLDAGSGPGKLAFRLAEIATQLRVVGVDISPDMVRLASDRAVRSGMGERVRFEVGDVAHLPYADCNFDMVVSTFSMHHWPDPAHGLAEIYRVLKPGGPACIYDLSGPVLQALHHHRGLEQAVEASPFQDRSIEVFRWPWGVPAMRRMCLRRAPGGSGQAGTD